MMQGKEEVECTYKYEARRHPPPPSPPPPTEGRLWLVHTQYGTVSSNWFEAEDRQYPPETILLPANSSTDGN